MRYKIIGIDLDGTLLDSRGRVSPANVAAVGRARDAGVIVVPCTGRSWNESRGVVAGLRGYDVGVFVTGAVVGRLDTGETLDVAVLDAGLAMELVRYLEHLPEAVLVYRQSEHCGHDYLVAGRGALTPNTRWWFDANGLTVHFQEELGPDDAEHVLRVGMVARSDRIHEITPGLRERFGDRVLAHSFEAVTTREAAEPTHVLEVFAAGVDKWRGLQWIAQREGVTADQVAVIGDQVNDLGMFHEAGCAIAMDNAPQTVKDAADYITGHCDRDGAAHAIDQLLDQQWG